MIHTTPLTHQALLMAHNIQPLNGAASITTTTIGGSTYALVAANLDDGVQIINIDDPYNPTNVSSITDGTQYPTLDGAVFIT